MPMVIQVFWPLTTHWPSTSRAVVRSRSRSVPPPGSLMPKQSRQSPEATSGRSRDIEPQAGSDRVRMAIPVPT